MIYRPPPSFDPEAPIIVIDIGNTTTSVAMWHSGKLKTPLTGATEDPGPFEEAYAAHLDGDVRRGFDRIRRHRSTAR